MVNCIKLISLDINALAPLLHMHSDVPRRTEILHWSFIIPPWEASLWLKQFEGND